MKNFPNNLKYILALLLFLTFLFSQFPSRVLATSTLTTGITSFWKLEESSGTRVDDLGANNLGVSGSVGSATGKIGNAASFSSPNYLTINDNASLKTGNTDFSVSAWVYLSSLAGVQSIIAKSGAPGSDSSLSEYALYYFNNTFTFATYGSGAPAAGYAASTGSPSINTWYHLVGVHNYATNTNYLYVNAGTPASIVSVEHAETAASFQIGAFGGGFPFGGRIDAAGFWRKALTSSEVTELYNSTSGIEYPFSSISTDATISAGTLASQALAGTFTGGATIGASSALTVTVPDANKTNAALALTKGNANSIVKYVKGSQPADDTAYTNTYSSGSTQITVANNDIIWLLVTAEDTTTKLYYKITVTVSPGTISITTPVAYQVFQRNGSNQANIAITGTYSGTPTSIEASWNGGTYTTIVASPNGGTFSGTLSNQPAGQGTLTVRYTNDNSVSVAKSYIGIGDVFVIAGQSNASGKGFNNQTYSHATLKAGMFGNDDNWKELADPVDIDTNQVDAVSDDPTIPGVYPRGSIWPGIATLFMADQNVPVAFIPTSLSATAISAWQPNASNHGDTTTLYGSMYRRINAAGGAKAVLFWQGESDALAGVSQSSYKTQLEAFANAVYSDFGIKVSTAVIGDFSSLTGTYLDNIRLAEQQAWNDGANVLIGPELYNINLSDESGDGLHFRSDADIQTAANRWWAALKQDFYSGTSGRGPRLSSAQYNADKTSIYLTFTSNDLPLLPASGYSGFAAKDGGVAATISSITKTATNQLRIDLASAAAGAITVSLGAGRTGIGATLPTDSSTYNLPAEIFVDQATTLLTHTITSFVGANGSISPSGATTVNDGSSQSFTITPSAHYHVSDVLVDSVSVGAVTSYNFTNVTTDHTISATFAIDTKTLTYTAGTHGSLTGTSPQTVNYGADGSAVTAVADSGYHFVNWSDSSTANPRTDTNITDNISVTANFAITTYTITSSAGSNGSISPSGATTVNSGASQTSTITANSGYHISDVVVDGSSVGAVSSYAFNNVTADHTISATFAATSSGGGGGGMPAGWSNVPVAPTSGFKIITNQGVSTTTNRLVTLNFNAGSDVKKMAISLTGDFSDASQENYSPTKQIDLCSKLGGLIKNPTCPDGQYTVFVKFYTAYGVASNVVSTKINLATKPVITTFAIFVKPLSFGMTSSDVRRLQTLLATKPEIYPEGKITGYFGLLTKKAVQNFQLHYGVVTSKSDSGFGYVGPKTRAKLQEIFGNK